MGCAESNAQTLEMWAQRGKLLLAQVEHPHPSHTWRKLQYQKPDPRCLPGARPRYGKGMSIRVLNKGSDSTAL
jgi:hypothetical protein